MKPARQNRIFIFIATVIFICGSFVFPNQLYAEKEWTIMVYMGADNNTEPYAIQDINEMELIGSTINSNVVVQIDRIPGYDDSNDNWTTTRRYYITQDQENINQINSTLVSDLGEKNMGDPQTLHDFISWAMASYPAEKYFLIIWNHGDGWRKNLDNTPHLIPSEIAGNHEIEKNEINQLLMNPSSLPDISFPQNPFKTSYSRGACQDETDNNDILHNDEIQSALNEIPMLDILGFNACVMGMIEVAHEFKDQAYYMIASEENMWALGLPYDLFLAELYYDPVMSAPALCSTVVESFIYDMQNHGNFDQTLSAIDLYQMDQVIANLNSFCTELITNGIWSEMDQYFPSAQQFGNDNPFYDLYHIAYLAWANLSGQSIKNAAINLASAIDNAVIYERHGYELPNAHGLSICMPQSQYSYEAFDYLHGNIDFISETNWTSFLQYYWGGGDLIFDIPEPNDYFTQAGLPLDPQYYYDSYISTISDDDWWLINSGIDETVQIELDVPINADYDIYLWDQDGLNILDGSYNPGNGVDELISYHSANPEFMYLHIIPDASFSNQPYYIHVSQTGNDKGWFRLSYDDNNPYSGYYCSYEGDVLGVNFSLPSYPMKIDKIWIYFTNLDGAGTGGDGSFYLLFYDNYGWVIDPIEIGSLTPVATGWNYLDLSEHDIKIYTSFFLGIYYDGINTPCIGFDDYARGMDYYYNSSTGEWTYMEDALFFRVDVSYPEVYLCGDANNDGAVNVSDAVWVINYVFVGGPEPDPFLSGEVNCDGAVNVSDAVWLINYVFVGGNDPCDSNPGSPNGDGIPDC